MISLSDTLKDRAKTHGCYAEQSSITQQIKDAIKSGPSYAHMSQHERETLEVDENA